MVSLWLGGIVGANAAPCHESSFSLAGGPLSTASDWREFNAANQMLVHESGHLNGTSLSANYKCAPWQVDAQLAAIQGTRAYQGYTSGGRAVMSRSAIRQLEGKLQVLFEFEEAWQLGAQLARQALKREMASASGAQGYPEHFGWNLLSLGVQWQPRLGPGELALTAWAGKSIDANLRVTLPGRDTTHMFPGASRRRTLAASWRTQLTPNWHFRAGVDYQRNDIAPGATAVVRYQGFPVGAAHQPQTRITDRMVAVHLGYTF